MFKINDFLVYKKDVCKVINIKKNNLNNTEYYILMPIDDDSLIIEVPVNNKLGNIRSVISKEEVEKIIKEIPNIEVINPENDKLIEQEYKKLLFNGSHKELITIIKTTYLRNKKRTDSNKKYSEKDKTYFDKAERLLYNEFSIVLNKTYEETKEYIKIKIEELLK